MDNDPILTFTSDFGNREYYVGAVKGVIAGIAPRARVIDISHEIASHDLLEGAFAVAAACGTFPARTIHLVVVDPGVGSSRRGIIATTANYLYVAPDNGVLSFIFEQEEVSRVISIEAEHYFRRPVSPTFHARDIFGPVAGWLAQGTEARQFGPEITDYVRMSLPPPQRGAGRQVETLVLHVDKFGNLITGLRPQDIERLLGEDLKPAAARLGGHEVRGLSQYYSESGGESAFMILGSAGYYEIAMHRRPAARLLEIRRGAKVTFDF